MLRQVIVILCATIFISSYQRSYSQAKLVMDINTKPAGLLPDDEYEAIFIRSGNYLYFPNGKRGNNELWRTDGTSSGTQKVFSLSKKYNADYYPNDFVDFNGKLFFPSYDGDHGQELWYSDGTASGTNIIDVIPGKGSSNPYGCQAIGNKLYFFVVNDENTAHELWQSDGTQDGTSVVKTFPVQGTNYTYLGDAVAAGNYYYFIVQDYKNNVFQIWSSDGTTSGTLLLHTFPAGAWLTNMTAVGNKVFFTMFGSSSGNSDEVWVSDGTVAGTSSVIDIDNPQSFYAYNDKLVFAAANGIYISDGTSAGTTLLYYSYVYGVGVLNNTLYILAPHQLISSDGTAGGTQAVAQLATSDVYLSFWGRLPLVNGKLIIEVQSDDTGQEIGISDGTVEGTQLLKDIQPGPGSGMVRAQESINGKVVFVADDGVHGAELWVTDGTSDGTVFLKDVLPGTQDSSPSTLSPLTDNLYYTVNVDQYSELWSTQLSNLTTQTVTGSTEDYFFLARTSSDLYYMTGGSAIRRLNGASGGLIDVQRFSNINGYGLSSGYTFGNSILFSFAPGYTDGTPRTGREYWKADASGASLLKDINPGAASGIGYLRGFVSGKKFIFAGTDGVVGSELWVSDGTTGGTSLLLDINPGGGDSSPEYYADVNGVVFFSADDGVHGRELWKTDGTTAGTLLVKDIVPGTDGSTPSYLAALGSYLFFSAYDATNGWALWKTDGTEAGTAILKDIYAGNDVAYYPSNLIAINGSLFFSCSDGVHGEELWVSDGTAGGTRMIEIVPGAKGSSPSLFINANQWACFTANNQIWVSDGLTAKMITDGAPSLEMVYSDKAIYFPYVSEDYGNELFYVPFADAAPAVITGIEDNEYLVDIYPNPSSQQIGFAVSGIEGTATIEIIDMNGRVMDTMSVENKTEVKHSLARYPTAIYIAKIVTNKGITYRRIVKI